MKRYEMFKNEDVDYIEKILASFINEEINIEKVLKNATCKNCYWNKISPSINKLPHYSCTAPFDYIGMQLYDCTQYKPL